MTGFLSSSQLPFFFPNVEGRVGEKETWRKRKNIKFCHCHIKNDNFIVRCKLLAYRTTYSGIQIKKKKKHEKCSAINIQGTCSSPVTHKYCEGR